MNIREELKRLEARGVHVIDNPINGISAQGLRELTYELREYLYNMERSRVEKTRFQCARLIESMGDNCCASCTATHIVEALGNEWTTKQGTWIKRLAKLLKAKSAERLPSGKSANGHKMSSDDMARFGKLARDNCSMFSQVFARLTSNLRWERGLFGVEESGSCFWSCHREALDVLEHYGSFAFQLFEDANMARGLARCWVAIPDDESEFAVIFNRYCQKHCDINLVTMARLLALELNCSYYKLRSLRNFDTWDGLVYINSGSGFSIGAFDVIDGQDFVDLQFERVNPLYECYECGRSRTREQLTDIEGDLYCNNCVSDLFYYCEDCDSYHDRDSGGTFVGSWSDRLVCDDCLEHYSWCEHCEHWYDPDYVSFSEVNFRNGSESWCQGCVDNEYSCREIFECAGCDELFHCDCEYEVNDTLFCEECGREKEKEEEAA